MLKKFLNKKAEVSSSTIVMIILALAGFVIVLLAYSQVNWTGLVDRDACHQSVIMRGSLPSQFGLKDYVPLKCKTQKICLGKDCSDFEGEKGIWNFEVSEGAKGQKEIEKLISQEMIDCWKMMGEGKVSIFSKSLAEDLGFGSVYPSCVICSRIAVGEKNAPTESVLENVNPLQYMLEYKYPGEDMTYFEYLIGEEVHMSIKEKQNLFNVENKLEIKDDDFEGEVNIGVNEEGEKIETGDADKLEGKEIDYDSDEIGIIFMQITAPQHLDYLKKTALSALGVGATGHYLSFGLTTKAVTKFPIVSAILGAGAIGFQQGNILWQKHVTAGYCGDVSYGGSEREGCSVVRTVAYDVDEIKKYCKVIESIP